MARPKKQPDTIQVKSKIEDAIQVETPNEKYFRYWQRFIGFDIMEVKTGKVLSKGEFYRKHTDSAELLSYDKVKLDSRFLAISKS